MVSSLVLFSCNQGNKSGNVYPSGNGDSVSAALSGGEVQNVVSELYPSEEEMPLEALITGVLHDEEATKEMENTGWFGIFKDRDKYYITPTTVKIDRAFDPIADDNEDDPSGWTGWEVSTVNIDDALILISGDTRLPEGEIDYDPMLWGIVVGVGGDMEFEFKNIVYKLFATGDEAPYDSNPGETVYKNYRLFIQAKIGDKVKTQMLAATPYFDDASFEIMFVGDIDNDGIMDLIIDTHNHYNVYRPTVYLSSFADEEEIMKPVAMHRSMGC